MKTLFEITIETAQAEAMDRIGRELTKDELHSVRKGLEWGLTTSIDGIWDAIFDDLTNT